MSSLKDHLRWRKGEQTGGVENQSLLALIPLAIATKLHREEGGTLQGSKNSLRPGKPTSRPWWLLPHWRNALKDLAGPPLGHGQISTTIPRVKTDQEEGLRSRVTGALELHQRRTPISVPSTESDWLPSKGHFPGPRNDIGRRTGTWAGLC